MKNVFKKSDRNEGDGLKANFRVRYLIFRWMRVRSWWKT